MTRSSLTSSRRRFLKQTIGFSAIASVAGRQSLFAFDETTENDIHLLMLGDFGSGDEKQQAVANGMKNYVATWKRKPEGLLLLGDNFYTKLPGGVDSPQWRLGFEEMYPADHFPGKCWAVLGNHDYHNNKDGEKIQLAYAAKNPTGRWTMPAKWYRFDLGKKPDGSPAATFICLDTNLPAVSGGIDKESGKRKTSMTEDEAAAQLTWLKAELAKPRAAFTFVVGHHPLYTNGKHGDNKHMIRYLDDLLIEHKVPFYLAGHDHDLQHLEFENHPTSFVVSGGGGARAYEIKNNGRGPFAKMVYGFSHLRLNDRRAVITHLDANRKTLHTFHKTIDGRVSIG